MAHHVGQACQVPASHQVIFRKPPGGSPDSLDAFALAKAIRDIDTAFELWYTCYSCVQMTWLHFRTLIVA